MASDVQRPNDLAQRLDGVLRREGHDVRGEILESLLETLYFASLRTEEGESIRCQVAYMDPANPDPSPPKRVVKDRWQVTPLGSSITLNVASVVKLAKATDPRTSSFAVYEDANGGVQIWGLVDQGNQYHDFVNFDSGSGPQPPGLQGDAVDAATVVRLDATTQLRAVVEKECVAGLQPRHRDPDEFCPHVPTKLGDAAAASAVVTVNSTCSGYPLSGTTPFGWYPPCPRGPLSPHFAMKLVARAGGVIVRSLKDLCRCRTAEPEREVVVIGDVPFRTARPDGVLEPEVAPSTRRDRLRRLDDPASADRRRKRSAGEHVVRLVRDADVAGEVHEDVQKREGDRRDMGSRWIQRAHPVAREAGGDLVDVGARELEVDDGEGEPTDL